MPTVRIHENESFDAGLRRFKRSCDKAGIFSDVRRHEFYEKPSWERKRKMSAAVKRTARRRMRDERRRTRLY